MFSKPLIIVAVFSLLILSGCASMSESECQVANWRIIGAEDGAAGYNPDARLSRHRKACAKYGISPNYDQYQLGYEDGIVRFCTASNGFFRAKGGYQYTGICPSDLEDDFLAGYRPGRELFEINSDISRLEGNVTKAKSELKELEERANAAEAGLIADGKTPQERQQLLQELRDAQQERGRLEEEIRNLENQVSERRGEYNVLSAQYEY